MPVAVQVQRWLARAYRHRRQLRFIPSQQSKYGAEPGQHYHSCYPIRYRRLTNKGYDSPSVPQPADGAIRKVRSRMYSRAKPDVACECVRDALQKTGHQQNTDALKTKLFVY